MTDNIKRYIITEPLKPRVWNYRVAPDIGENVKLQNTLLDCYNKIIIGNNVFFGHDVKLLTSYHDYSYTRLRRQKEIKSKMIVISDGAWIASGAIILAGVTIGLNAVVGAGSVVTRDIPDFELWAGNSAKRIKRILPHYEPTKI